MPTKRVSYPAEFKALSDELGQVEAIVSVFGNVDYQGDRVMPGAFQKSIAEWQESGHPVPVIFSHDWSDVWSHIGVVDQLEETEKGLKALYTLDVADNPVAAQVYRLMKRRSIKEHSFGYDVRKEHKAKDGANELQELGIIELGPTLKGANPDTELLAVKSALEGCMTYATPTRSSEGWMKAGRSISTKNESLLRDANKAGYAMMESGHLMLDAINRVLGSLGDPEEENKTTDEEKAQAEELKAVDVARLELEARIMKVKE